MKKIKSSIKINSHSKKRFLSKKFLSIFGISVIAVVPSALILTSALNQQLIKPTSLKNNKLSTDNLSVTIDNPDASAFQSQVKPLVPIEYNTFMPLISTPWGPVGFWKNEIRALDWFGAERWKLDTTSFAPSPHTTYVNRSFINWAYDFSKNEIWLLSNGYQNKKQKFVRVSGETGNVIGDPIDLAKNPSSVYDMYYFIQVLANGNVMAYGNGSVWDKKFDILDVKTNLITTKTSKIDTKIINQLVTDNTSAGAQVRLMNIVPIIDNYNIMVFQRYTTQNSNMNVGFLLVDDEQNIIFNDNNNEWSKLVNLFSAPKPPANRLFPNKAFYKLLDGRVIFVAFNQLIVFDGNQIKTGRNFYKSFNLNNIVTSFSFDSSENLYFTAQGETKIFKLTPPKLSDSTDQLKVDTYYDMNGSPINEIKNNATNFVLYNVYNYSGQIMLVKPYELLNPGEGNSLPFKGWPSEENIKKEMYGLAAAITNNKNSIGKGDSKGLLNTKNAFQFSADFEISQDILNKKLPSEITQDDLTLLNQSFLTNNVEKDANGKIKYPPFIKSNINDETKSFTIQVYLDQIPWFADSLPSNWIPLKIEKVFSTQNDIQSRIKWKNVNSDYDFLNTLPTKVNQNDLNRFDPFLIDLTSQRVMKNQHQIYPKKEYTTTSANDDTGIIGIQVTYTYMPLGVAIEEKNALKYTISSNFSIFKSSDVKQFNWNTDGTNNNSSSNIANIPSLKKFTEANILPSSINAALQSQLLEFIDLNDSRGYPISKMKSIISANDNQGSLTLNLTLPQDYYGDEQSFTHTYTNLNKIGSYTFSYKSPTILNNGSISTTTTDYSKVLPSQVTEEQIFADFISYSGYDGLDLVTTLLPNDANGTLTVQVELTNNYPKSVATINTFSFKNNKYISTHTFNNFLTTAQYQKQYVVNFKNNNDPSLSEIKNMEVDTILKGINSPIKKGITIGDKTYTSKKDLVELFIATKGISIPTIQDSNVTIYGDNQSGILTFELLFPTNETGLSYPLSFTSTFTGFLQGVAVPTSDIFILKNQDNLTKDVLNKLPSQISKELTDNPKLIENYFVRTLGGQFDQLIKDPTKYKITTYPNDLTGTLGITIEFNGVTDPKTLKLYSQSYMGFKVV